MTRNRRLLWAFMVAWVLFLGGVLVLVGTSDCYVFGECDNSGLWIAGFWIVLAILIVGSLVALIVEGLRKGERDRQMAEDMREIRRRLEDEDESVPAAPTMYRYR